MLAVIVLLALASWLLANLSLVLGLSVASRGRDAQDYLPSAPTARGYRARRLHACQARIRHTGDDAHHDRRRVYPGFSQYERRASHRHISVFVFEPR